jgi:branched-chain amino acid transport system substrate-binding protein
MKRIVVLILVASVVSGACSGTPKPLVIGAVYPLTGSQGPGGRDEYRGVKLAAEMINHAGGVDGRRVELRTIDVPGSDAAPEAIRSLHDDGVSVVVGSHGSTISEPAAASAARLGMLFWETGAVGEMSPVGKGDRVFRVAPTGHILGRAAIDFVAHTFARRLHRDPRSLRFGVLAVNDVYGQAVAAGALQTIQRLGLHLAGEVRYSVENLDAAQVVRRLGLLRPDVVFAASYLDDGIALRREMVRQHLPLVTSIGTSSSYCMPQFGGALGRAAIGLFASDKPDANAIGTRGLRPEARTLLRNVSGQYRRRYATEMNAPALAGFSAAWALFNDVLPRAADPSDPSAVARAVRAVHLPWGSLPNGSGLEFGPAASVSSGDNLRAASVIWEWTGPGQREVVWPPRFATGPVQVLTPLS